MKIVRRDIVIIISVILFIPVFIFLLNQLDIKEKFNLRSFNSIKKIELKGVVINKFTDLENHNLPSVVIVSSVGDTNFISLLRDKSGLFDYLVINDTIYKERNSIEVLIKRNAKNDTIINLDYGVDN